MKVLSEFELKSLEHQASVLPIEPPLFVLDLNSKQTQINNYRSGVLDVLSYHSQIDWNFELIKATANPGLTMALKVFFLCF